jgi:ubiquinone/menaquinone biosynthesis C-methylase UbiE
MDKKILYDKKYEQIHLQPSLYFPKQFKYIEKNYCKSLKSKVLDLGGGTGEYSLLLQGMSYDITLFDFSMEAIKRAKSIGVKKTICNDFLSYDFEDESFDIILVKGFSLLNTDNEHTFLAMIQQMKAILNSEGIIIYMGESNLSASWSESAWYQLGQTEIKKYFDSYLLLPAFRYQLILPLFFNQWITRVLMNFKSLPRSISLVGIIK